MSSGNDEYDRKASDLFWRLPQELLQMMELQRLEEVRRRQMEMVKLKKTTLEEFGELHFTPDSPRWPQALELALATFTRVKRSDCDHVYLRWDPCKSTDAWKISTNGWEGYVWTPELLKALGF